MEPSSVFGEVDPDHLARRAASFGGDAAGYAEERPDYPAEGVRWALENAPEGRILDLGAGTGKLTGMLTGRDVVAVEPDPDMLAVLRRIHPDVEAHRGGAERIPLEDGTVAAVVAGQSMHWFDMGRALPEIARVLVPGGVLAGLWNLDDDRVPWVAGFKETARSTASYRQWRPEAIAIGGAHFTDVEWEMFAHGQRRGAEALVRTVATHSHVLTLEAGEREDLLDRVRTYLEETKETATGEFTLPIVTRVVRARRA